MLVVLLLVGALVVALGRTRIPAPREVPQHHARVDPAAHALLDRLGRAWRPASPCEFCLTLWAADILRSRDGLGPGAASASLTGLVAGMFVGRLVGGRLALRFGVDRCSTRRWRWPRRASRCSGRRTWAPLAIAGLMICGLGVALHYPLGISRAIDAAEGGPTWPRRARRWRWPSPSGSARSRWARWPTRSGCTRRSSSYPRCLRSPRSACGSADGAASTPPAAVSA